MTGSERSTRESRTNQRLDEDDLWPLSLLAVGLPTLTVACTLNTSPCTVQGCTRDLCDWIGVRTAVEAVAWAAGHHLI